MTAAAITLRLARAADARAIACLSRDLIETGLGWTYRPERITRLIEDRDTTTLVACDRGRLAGFAVMHFGNEHAHLVLLAVREQQQRQGVARRMMEWLLASAATAGIATLHLELRAGNAAACAFYRAMGFTETQLVPGYYRRRESAVRMVRILRPAGPAAFTWRPGQPGGP